MRGDGDGWTTCRAGHRHWGRHGAAGLLLVADDVRGRPHVLLQHRAHWSHHGGTWGVPGGARDSVETPAQAALREVREEVRVDLSGGEQVADVVDDHGGWAYVTVLVRLPERRPASPGNGESLELRWVSAQDVSELPLHPGFAATWPQVRAGLVTSPPAAG